MAILVAAVFWTWLWGPVGLLLATPLTVCVVVIGRHVPSLEFLSVLLSDDPGLRPETRLYQRLLAMDVDEATEIAEEFLKRESLADFYDEIMIPALALAEEDRHQGKLDPARQEFVFANMRLLVEDLAERAQSLAAQNHESKAGNENAAQQTAPTESQATVLCVPARDEADEIAAVMLAELLLKEGVRARALPLTPAAGESLGTPGGQNASVASVVAVPPYGYMQARLLCRRLHERFPHLKLVASILTEQDDESLRQRRPEIPTAQVASSLRQTLEGIRSSLADKADSSTESLSRAAA